MVKIGLIQMRCEKGAITENLKTLSHHIDEADAKDMDIIGFPETSITGLTNPNKYPESIVPLDGAAVDTVLEMTRGRKVTVLPGLIEENPKGKPFITQIVIRNGRRIGSYRKNVVQEDDGSEDEWFSPGDTIPVFTHDDVSFGIAICADIDNERVFAECARQGAQIVFELAAPGLYGEQSNRDWQSGFEWWEGVCKKHLEVYAKKYKIWIAVSTQAGRTVDEDFPGGGYIFAPDGQRVYATPNWLPCSVYLGLDLTTYQVVEL